MMRNVASRLVLITVVVCAGSLLPPSSLAGDEWRAVSPEELAMKTAKVESDADAEAIFWEVRIDDSSSENLSMQHYVRVKIFTDRGREKYSKFDIPFSKGKKIKDIAARVIKEDGTAVEIQKEEIFEREIIKSNGVKVKAKSFAIPNLTPGVIVEYRYREVISDAGATGMHLRFQRDIPVQTLSYYYKPYDKKKPNYQSFNFEDTKFVEGEKGFWVATRSNVPALKEEPQMPPEDQVVPWMLLQAVRFNVTTENFGFTISIKDPASPAYWGAVGNDKSFLTTFMNKPDKDVKRVANEVTAAAKTDDEKLRKLYEYCQSQIHNTTFDTTLSDDQRKKLPKNESLGDVVKHKTASSQFIDMLFGGLASALGYETRIAFSGDRSEMFFKPEMRNESFIHPAAIAVRTGDDWRFFNPGTKFLPYGMLLWYEEDVWALLVGEKTHGWVHIPYTTYDKTVAHRNGKFKLQEDGTLDGDVTIELSGQDALSYRMENYDNSANKREEDLRDEVKQRVATAEVSNIRIENLEDASKPLLQTYRIHVPQYAQKTGKRLFLQPSFFEYGQPSMFSSDTRKYDVYFHYPWSQDDKIEIDLPPGYALDNAERPSSFSADQVSQYKIDLGITTDHRTLILHREFFFGGGGNMLFKRSAYSQVKLLFDQLHKSDEHTITLKQAATN
jgi:hypothetical protein